MYGQKRGLKLSPDWVNSIIAVRDGSTGWATHYGDDNTDVVIWLKVKPKRASQYGVLYHEVYHAVDIIAHDLDPQYGLYDKVGMSEPRAYIYEHIVNQLNSKLW